MPNDYLVPLIALFGILCTVVSPVILAYLTSRTNAEARAQASAEARDMREEDWARQDEVARRVEQAAHRARLVAEQATIATRSMMYKQDVAEGQRADAAVKLEEVHKIVNQQRSDMLAYQAVLLDALRVAGVAVPADETVEDR